MIDHISSPILSQLPPLNGQEARGANNNSVHSGELSEEEKAQVEELKKIDQEVRTHEAAHKNAGGQYASNPTYTYTVGPDDQRYATGGEVQIDSAPIEGDPEATIAKMDVVIAAALAPAEPSAQDRKVAAAAVAARNKAQAELLEKKQAEQSEQSDGIKNFDINDFGGTPIPSVNKAYENGLDLGAEAKVQSGVNFSLTS